MKKNIVLLLLMLLLVVGCKKEPKCPEGFNEENGKCVHEVERIKAEVSYSCDEGAELEGDTCVREIIQPAIEINGCKEGLTESNGYCTGTLTEKATDGYKCNSGETLKGTKCVKSTVDNDALTSTPGCPNDFDYLDGKCLANARPPMGVNPGDCDWENQDYTNCTCASGDYYRSSDHFCYSTAKVGWMYECASGTTLKDGKCYRETETDAIPAKTCKTGYTLNGDTCTKTVKEKAGKTLSCSDGYELKTDDCRKTEVTPAIAEYHCPDDYNQDGSDCVKTEVREME